MPSEGRGRDERNGEGEGWRRRKGDERGAGSGLRRRRGGWVEALAGWQIRMLESGKRRSYGAGVRRTGKGEVDDVVAAGGREDELVGRGSLGCQDRLRLERRLG